MLAYFFTAVIGLSLAAIKIPIHRDLDALPNQIENLKSGTKLTNYQNVSSI